MDPGSALTEPVIGRAFARPVGSLVRDDDGDSTFRLVAALWWLLWFVFVLALYEVQPLPQLEKRWLHSTANF
jgi:hypothetical protein